MTTARMWCAALVTWGMAAVAGMGVAVYSPDLLPPVGLSAAAAAEVPRAGTKEHAAAAGAPGRAAAVGSKPVTTARANPDDAPGARQRAADRAITYAESLGWRSGIAVVDLRTGEITTAGDAEGFFRMESTVKLFVAARLLIDGKMTRATEPAARRMLTVSDDAAASALYPRVGGDGLQAWVATRYRLGRLGTPPVRGAGQWGSTQVTPLGMARFLSKAHSDRKVGPWLVRALEEMEPIAADGTNQLVGLRAADRLAAVKQGWGGDGNPSDVEGTPSVGYVNQGRYAVAIYTARLPETSLARAQAVVSEQARLLLPQGRMPRF